MWFMAMPWVCIVPKLPVIRLRAQIVGTLDPTDADARRRLNAVDFSLEGFTMSGVKLKGVAAAVGDGRIGVEVGSTGQNFAAAYTAGAERHFTLREYNFQPDDNWRSQMVHEAAHAAFDLGKEQPPNEIDEAVAYLGETVWFRAGGLGRVITAPAAAARIYGAASEIEARLNLHTTPGQHLRRDQVRHLIAAINGHPGYAPSAAP
jgi:hypothetical protein